jgi:peptidoglycan/xylan/chitin deacetylase (PgdA/CDA1 family)
MRRARSSIRSGRPVERGPRLGRRVALTFDDGPGDATPAVLDALDALGLRATFFVIGQQVPERTALLRRMIDAGHAVGVHAWEHPNLVEEPGRAGQEIDRCAAIVQEASGERPRVFRPPLGAWDGGVLAAAHERGLTTVLWDVNPHDYAGGEATAETIAADVLAGVRRGSIVLLHDGGPAPSREPLLGALPAIAEGLSERSLEAVTVHDLLGISASD